MNSMEFDHGEGPGIATATVMGTILIVWFWATVMVGALVMLAPNASTRVELGASYFGVLGTILLATKSRWAGWGFVAFLVSNIGWLYFSRINGHDFMFWQQVAFTISSVLGICVWLLKDYWLAIGAALFFALGGDALEDTGDGL